MTRLEFPSGFLWGVGTSAYQVEGAAHLDGRGDSIWDTFSQVPGAVLDGHSGATACDHYARYREDVALMAVLNVGAYRFSTSWSRVEPEGVGGSAINRRGLDFYSRLVDSLLERGIEPWPTLYHWDLPQALQDRGGWVNRDTVMRFVDYAHTMHSALGDRVTHWTTLNEPWCSAFLGHIAGVHAPGHRSAVEGLVVGHHLLLAHGLATQALRQSAPHARLGITLNFTVADAADSSNPADVAAAERLDLQFNRFFADPLLLGTYPAELWPELDAAGLTAGFEPTIHDEDLANICSPIDALGVNYYHGEMVGSQADPHLRQGLPAPTALPEASPHPLPEGIHTYERGLPRTGQGWEIQPEGLTRLLVRIHQDYTAKTDIQVYVTENGAAFDDEIDLQGDVHDSERHSFLVAHVGAVHAAIEQGARVAGYFAWSLLDNFEWSWGYTQRFGLIYVDFATQQRHIKSSGFWYAKLAKTNQLEIPLPLD